jgi:hypothetical protein
MMKKTLLGIAIAITAVSLLYAFSGDNADYPSGAPAGYTGSPGDGQNCANCHGGSASNVTGWITSNIPAEGYTPGTTYTITATASGSGNKGFEISPQNSSGTLLGTLIAGSGSQLTGSGKYITHTSASSSNPKVWTFSWVAPASGTGTVTFYGAFCVSKPVTKLSTLVVSENVSVPLTATASANPSTIVSGSTSQLNVTATGGTGTYTYAWTSNPAGFTSNLQNPVVSPTVTTTYSVTVTSGTQNANSSTMVTVVQPLSATATATPSTIYSGGTSQLDVTVTGGTGANSFAWTSVPAGFSSTMKNPVVSPTENTTYYVTVTSGTQRANSSVAVTVFQPLTVIATANPSSIMPGGTSQLDAIPTGGSGTYTYSWVSNPAGFTSTLKNPVVSPAATTEYTVTVNDGTMTNTGNVTVTVTLNPLSANATATPSTICAGQTSQLDVEATGGSGTYSYSWTSNPPGFTSTLKNPVVTPSANTQYIAVVTDGTQNAQSTADVTVIPAPTASAGNDTTYCSDITIIPLTGTATSYSTVLWTTSGTGTFTNASSLTGDYLPSAQDITSTAVDLTLTVDPVSPCAGQASSVRHILFDPCLGIPGNNGSAFSITLSPNPTQGMLQVSIRGMADNEATLTVIDMRGVTILTKPLNGTGDLTEKLDLSSKPGGLYFVRVQTPHGMQMQKLILQ